MKKIALIALMVASAAGVFAQDIKVSAGAGASYVSQIGLINSDNGTTKIDSTLSVSRFNANAFVDFTYGFVSLGIATDLGKGSVDTSGTKTELEMNNLDFLASVYGKFPVTISEGFSLFPLLGLGYSLNLDAKDKSSAPDKAKAALSYFYVGGGVGSDITVANGIFVRPLVLINWIPNYYKDVFEYGSSKITSNGIVINAGLNVGYKF